MVAAALLGLAPHVTNAAETWIGGIIEQIQGDSAARAGRTDVSWVKVTGNFGNSNCTADWAWFNSRTNPQMLAVALSAYAMEKQVHVYVDYDLTKINGYCQVVGIAST